MKKISLAFILLVMINSLSVNIYAADVRYNFMSHLETTADKIGGFDNSGGGWSTVTGSTGAAAGGVNGSCARFTFATKVGGSATQTGSYGVRFPSWSNSTTNLGDMYWQPITGKPKALSEALSEATHVSFYIKVPESSGFVRKIAFSIETKPTTSGGSSTNFLTAAKDMPTDGNWHLMQISLDEFMGGGNSFSSVTEDEMKTTKIPYKFAMVFSYTGFLENPTVPTAAGDVIQSVIYLDELMFERPITTDYPLAIPINETTDPYFLNANLDALTIGTCRTVLISQNQDISIPFSYTAADINSANIKLELQAPTVLTDIEGGVQYKTGSSYEITEPAALSDPLIIKVTSADGINTKTYTFNMVPKPFDLSVSSMKLNGGDEYLSEGANKLEFSVAYSGQNPTPISFLAILREKDSGKIIDMDYKFLGTKPDGFTDSLIFNFECPPVGDSYNITLYSYSSFLGLQLFSEPIIIGGGI